MQGIGRLIAGLPPNHNLIWAKAQEMSVIAHGFAIWSLNIDTVSFCFFIWYDISIALT